MRHHMTANGPVPFTPEEEAARDAEELAAQTPVAPQSISIAQARQQLIALGLYDTVNAAIAAMPITAQVDWEYRGSVERSYPLVGQMQQLLGWNDAQVDTFFIEAAKL